MLVKLKLVGAEKYQSDLKETEERTTESSSRIEAFLKKWRLAFVGIVTGAMGAFYALARVSPTLNAQMSRLRIAFEYLMMVIGDKLAPILKPIVDWLEKAIYKVADWIDAMPPEKFLAVAKAIQAIGSPLVTMMPALAGLIAGFSSLKSMIKEHGGVIPWLGELWSRFKDKLKEIWNWIYPYLLDIWSKIVEKAQEKWAQLKPVLLEKIEAAGKAVINYVKDRLKTSLEKWWERIRTGASRAWNRIKDVIWQPLRDAYHKVSYYVGLILDKLEKIPGIGGLISAGRERFGGGGGSTTTSTTNQQITVHVEGGKEWTDEDWVRRISERILDELARRSGT